MTNGPPTPGDIDKLRQIDEERDEALSKLLTPDEKMEYELSMSSTADHLRKELVGFNPSEAEFRDLFKRQQGIDSTYANEDLSDPTVRAAKAADEDKMMQEVKNSLGPDRAAALERAKDPEYQNLTMLSERYDLPAETSRAMVDIKQAAEDERQQLLSNTNIPPDRLDVALKAIEAETEKAARETLGDKAYGQYSQSAGGIKGLGTN